MMRQINAELILEKEIGTTKSAIEIFNVFYDLPYSIFLDSSLNAHELSESSIIVFDPFLVFISKGNSIKIIKGTHVEDYTGDPFLYLQELLGKYKNDYVSELPFTSGAIGYLSYDLCHRLETIVDNAKDDMDLPDMVFGFYNNAIIVDHNNGRVSAVVSSIGIEENRIRGQVTENQRDLKLLLEQKIDNIIDRVCKSSVHSEENISKKKPSFSPNIISTNFTVEEYCSMIIKAKEHIRNGDIYQVNLSQRFYTNIGGANPFDIYKDLRNINSAPFSAYMNLDSIKVLSSSPERFIKVSDRIIETRPIKGTRPRGRDLEEDSILRNELINSEKDGAENIMIVDLERNDLGRVCKIGSVNVEKLLSIEEYSTVFHLVSIVKGELLDNVDIVDCIKATFPGGSITGAPKIRAMEIIGELEPVKRNIYTGALGYIGFNGNCDLNIAIRTIIIKDDEAFFNVGGGIVWDSVPEEEYQETLDKGKALIKVLTER